MTFLRSLVLTASVLILSATGGSTVFAHDNNTNGNHYGSYQQHGYPYKSYDRYDRYDRHDRDNRSYNYWNVNLSPREREDASRRFYEAYSRQCGSNMAWRTYYGCDKFQPYQVGRRLEPGIVTLNLPGSVTRSLPRPHPDTRYVWVNRDILLVSKWDGTVLDRVISLR